MIRDAAAPAFAVRLHKGGPDAKLTLQPHSLSTDVLPWRTRQIRTRYLTVPPSTTRHAYDCLPYEAHGVYATQIARPSWVCSDNHSRVPRKHRLWMGTFTATSTSPIYVGLDHEELMRIDNALALQAYNMIGQSPCLISAFLLGQCYSDPASKCT